MTIRQETRRYLAEDEKHFALYAADTDIAKCYTSPWKQGAGAAFRALFSSSFELHYRGWRRVGISTARGSPTARESMGELVFAVRGRTGKLHGPTT